MFKRFKCYNVKTLKCYLALGAVLALAPWCLAGRVLLLLEPPCQGFVVVLSRRAAAKTRHLCAETWRGRGQGVFFLWFSGVVVLWCGVVVWCSGVVWCGVLCGVVWCVLKLDVRVLCWDIFFPKALSRYTNYSHFP